MELTGLAQALDPKGGRWTLVRVCTKIAKVSCVKTLLDQDNRTGTAESLFWFCVKCFISAKDPFGLYLGSVAAQRTRVWAATY
jgi:hypothetical protein